MMPKIWSLKTLYSMGVAISLLGFFWTISVIGPPPWQSVNSDRPSLPEISAKTTFVPTGNLSTDVQRALRLIGELNGEPGSSLTQDIKQAISRAESRLGLPADGFPDKSLLRHLQTEIEEKGRTENVGANAEEQDNVLFSSWALEKWLVAVQIMSAFSGVLLAWLTFFRSTDQHLKDVAVK